MRILFYATNGLGLGHVTRLLALSRAVARREPRHERLFLTRCEAGPFPEETDPFAIRIPGASRARKSGLTPKSYLQMAHPLLWQTVSSFDPHIMVVDTFPEGPEGELAPLMRWPIRKVFIYREFRKDAFPKDRIASLFSPYSLILAAHDEGTVSLPPPLDQDARVHFVGPITAGVPKNANRESLRNRLGLRSGEVAAILTLGGGGDPEAARIAGEAAQELRRKGVAVFASTGPLVRTPPEGITAREWFPVWPLAPWLPAFDLAIGGGGYNTVAELREAGLPTLLIPFHRDVDDQHARAKEAVQKGWARMATSSEEIRQGLEEILSQPSRPFPPTEREASAGGADRAAELLLSLHPAPASPTPPRP
jgi:UDP:flavonoid glycosyltransferase YjiC (YdhE family)